MVEDLGLARLGLGDEGLVEDVEDILADLLELGLDLLAVVADGANVLLRALGLLLLLDRGDDAPRGTSCSDDVLVGDGKEVALVNGELTADLQGVRLGSGVRRNRNSGAVAAWSGCSVRTAQAYLSDFLRNSQYVSCGGERGCGWRLTFMYVTISVSSTVSTRGLTRVGLGTPALTIVALSLFAQPGEESLAVATSITLSYCIDTRWIVPLALLGRSC